MYHLRRLSALVLSLAIAPLLFLPTPAAAANEDSMPLVLSSASALLMEKETGTVLLQQNAHQKLEPASVTKIMTLLLVMEAVDSGRLSLDELVPVSAHAAGMGGSQVYLKGGGAALGLRPYQVRGRGLGQRLRRGPGRAPGGQRVRLRGPDEPKGPVPGHGGHPLCQLHRSSPPPATSPPPGTLPSCPGADPPPPGYSAIHDYLTDSIRNGAFGLTNTNRLVRFYDGATGLKTGFTASAQYCMSATAQRNGMELIAVVMKAPTTAQRFQDASSLLDYGFANYALITPQPESPLAPVDVLLGRSKTVQPQLQRECHLLVEKTQADQVTTRVDLGPGRPGPGGPRPDPGGVPGLRWK